MLPFYPPLIFYGDNMIFCEYDDNKQCYGCGSCGKTVCREHINQLCDYCGYCEDGIGVTHD